MMVRVRLQTRGLKSGSTIVVCTMAAVASVVTGVLAGLLALGEALPSSPGEWGVAGWCKLWVNGGGGPLGPGKWKIKQSGSLSYLDYFLAC